MSTKTRFTITLPSSIGKDAPHNVIEHSGRVVIVGANGAGKTRLGSWIELQSPHRDAVHRISAQRSLSMPESVSTRNIDEAANELHFGVASASASVAQKAGNRWGGKPNTTLLNDFQRLMVYLFSEELDVSTKYRREARSVPVFRAAPDSKLDILQELWQDILPERALTVDGGKVSVGLPKNPPSYSGAEMSDGERVVFYLIGQCLAAPKGAMIVIDEPEIHLHRAIQTRLWDLVEARRPDCQFVYVTHDVDFAASRQGAVKIWIKSFDGEKWDWNIVPPDQEIPENLLLALIGSRKPVLFVEGTEESIDSWLYSAVYPEFTVIPNGSCESVIHNVSAFRSLKSLHALECFGLIDRDYRTEEELTQLASKGVYATHVAQVENLFLTEGSVRALCDKMNRPLPENVLKSISGKVFAEAAKKESTIVNQWTQTALHRSLRLVSLEGKSKAEFQHAVTSMNANIDVDRVFDPAEREVRRVIETEDYPRLLQLFKQKGLLQAQLAPLLSLTGSDIIETLKRFVNSPENDSIRKALRSGLPTISVAQSDVNTVP